MKCIHSFLCVCTCVSFYSAYRESWHHRSMTRSTLYSKFVSLHVSLSFALLIKDCTWCFRRLRSYQVCEGGRSQIGAAAGSEAPLTNIRLFLKTFFGLLSTRTCHFLITEKAFFYFYFKTFLMFLCGWFLSQTRFAYMHCSFPFAKNVTGLYLLWLLTRLLLCDL